MAQEIELKLAFPPAALAQVLAHPLLAAAEHKGPTKTLINTYFDTPDLALSAQRIALRTRKAGDVWLQTVKCAADSFGGLSSRPEWEQAYSGRFDFSAIETTAVRETLEQHHAALTPLFTTDFERDTLQLSPRQDVRILLMIDRGAVSANGRTETICELELELVTGSPDDLLDIACALAASLPLLPYDPSKAARGYRLFHGVPVSPAQLALPAADPALSAPENFRHAALAALAAWAANHHGALDNDGAEFIHQLRVALTRLRGLLKIFAPVLPEAFVAEWKDLLKMQATALGELRELQVLLSEIIAPALAEDSDARLEPLIRHAEAQCADALRTVRAKLAAPGAGLPLLALNRALLALPSAGNALPLKPFAAHALDRLWHKADKSLRQAMAERSNDSLHALRISIKHLKLANELFTGIYGKPCKRNARRLSRLQTRLGELHDLAQALPRLGSWVQADARFSEPVSFLAGWHAATSLKPRRTILRRAIQTLADTHWKHFPGTHSGAARKPDSCTDR